MRRSDFIKSVISRDRFRMFRVAILFLTAVVGLVACTTEYAKIFSSKASTLSSDWYKENEWAFNVDPSQEPKECLALSGGGIRSSAFSMGVMKGLSEVGLLQKLDVISAVSGGGYAATWYFSETLGQGAAEAGNLFEAPTLESVAKKVNWTDDKDNWFSLIAGDFCARYSSEFTIWACRPITGGVGLVSSFLPPTTEGHKTDMGQDYANIIGRTYHQPISQPIPTALDLTDLTVLSIRHRLPLLIMNASVAKTDKSLDLESVIFEFTPLRIGSDATGIGYATAAELSTQKRSYPLNIVASISGAAIDPDDLTTAIILRNTDLRYNMRTFGNNSNSYFVLTDGGLFGDNLGVFSLIRRGCKHIIAVDAEYDPEFKFEGYFKLNTNLSKLSEDRPHYNLAFNVPDIHDFRVNANNDSREKSWKCPGKRATSEEGILFDCEKPVLEGWVEKCEWGKDQRECASVSHHSTKITYVKLSGDRSVLKDREKALARYGATVMEFYKPDDTEFPQYPTSNIAWKENKFMAVLELGYRAVITNQELFR